MITETNKNRIANNIVTIINFIARHRNNLSRVFVKTKGAAYTLYVTYYCILYFKIALALELNQHEGNLTLT